MDFKRILRGPIFWVALAVAFVLVGSSVFAGVGAPTQVDTSQAVSDINGGKVDTATITDRDQLLELTLKDGSKIRTSYVTGQGVNLQELLQAKSDAGQLSGGYNVVVPSENILVTLLFSLLPIAIVVFLLFFFMGQMQGGGNKVMSFGKSKAKLITKDMPQTTFADVAGADEAVEELEEIKDFLADPAKFHAVGAKIPKGVLLYGPPGTGKTLLARAVAGEAGVPFFAISGSDFVEMFVGVGASRVRDLFEQAKANSPSIIFIDEIDAVGRHRGAGMGGGHDEREQTLNQMLVEMDGFDVTGGVILIAATNRPDILDPALLRPGRFDRQIAVDRPDLLGRFAILQVHAKGKPMADEVDLKAVARRTPGFTGADLANVLNEAALLTARLGLERLDDAALDEAIDRVIAGPQKRTRVMDDHEKSITAYHEAGHALVAAALPGNDPVHKITVLPRGRALGYTMVMPLEDRYSISRNQLLDQIAWAMGGRVAEEIVFHDPTTGASNDFEKATTIARQMVTQYGFSSNLGSVSFANGAEVFIGRDMGHRSEYSESTAQVIDAEIRAILDSAQDEAYKALNLNRKVLDTLAKELLEKETLNHEEIAKIFKTVKKLPKRTQWLSKKTRPVKAGPIAVPKKKTK